MTQRPSISTANTTKPKIQRIGKRPVVDRRAKRCLACQHPQRYAMEADLLQGIKTLKTVGEQYGLSQASIRTHRGVCMPTSEGDVVARLRAEIAKPIPGCEDSPFVARIRLVEEVGIKMLLAAQEKGDARNAGALLGHLLRGAELIGKRTGELVDKRERTEIHHGGLMVMGVPSLPQRQVRGVLAAPRDGDLVAPEVAQLGTTLEEIEAEIVENGPFPAETAS
jgi:hypothetical protein